MADLRLLLAVVTCVFVGASCCTTSGGGATPSGNTVPFTALVVHVSSSGPTNSALPVLHSNMAALFDDRLKPPLAEVLHATTTLVIPDYHDGTVRMTLRQGVSASAVEGVRRELRAEPRVTSVDGV